MNVYNFYSSANNLYRRKVPLLPKLISFGIRLIFGCWIPYSAEIGQGTKLGYGGIGVVIHSRAKIGKNCLINTGVTIGGTSHKYDVPQLGDNVFVGLVQKFWDRLKSVTTLLLEQTQ